MNTILIANRGEVVARVLRTARRMGLRVAVVYTAPDAAMPYVRQADVALAVPDYLDGAAMIAAAKSCAAQAIHPGYGFLAESDAFAASVIDAGLCWIGPSPEAMRAMGNKASAKRALRSASVPLLAGYEGERQDEATLCQQGATIGYPLMVKAAAGGGGRGMRLVHDAQQLAPALERARSEALQSFGCGDLILEQAVIAPRHIEMQIFGDRFGNLVHLGERDCSVQRRHQKLIEESPSPAVDAALRGRLSAAAIAVGRSCAYEGAGTVEFLLDADGQFWFIEMNTRLQVEHPVTEAVTGLDLVEWQLRVAAGEPLPLSQADIDARLAAGGHAIEVRLCAEDPVRRFMPQSGRIAHWQRPATLRCEDALASGQQVSPLYDSMLAKLIGHAPTREQARVAMLAGLDSTLLLGLPTNQDYLAACLDAPAFVAGAVTTGFVETFDFAPAPLAPAMACAAILARHRAGDNLLLAGWSNSAALPVVLKLLVDGAQVAISASACGADTWRIGEQTVQIMQCKANCLALRIDGRPTTLAWAHHDEAVFVRHAGCNHILYDQSFAPAPRAASARAGVVRAPMNGRIVALHASCGQVLAAGAPLLVIDAMKMEHIVGAPCAGTVRQIHIQLGQQVGPGLVMIDIAPLENAT